MARIILWVLVAAVALVGPDGRARSLAGGDADSGAVRTAAAIVPQGPYVTVDPADGATGVHPDTVVHVATRGTLAHVEVLADGDDPVPGRTDANGREWQTRAPLQINRTYHVTIDLVSDSPEPLHFVTSFSTMTGKVVTAQIQPSNGSTVGVGMPIVVRFDRPVKNQDAMLQALQVTASPAVDGRWDWFSSTEVHYRPASYWQPGETVSIDTNLDGVDAGGGTWGFGSQHVTFHVGDAHVSVVDVVSHVMTVTENGKVVRTMSISAGRPQYPTMNGVHVVWGKAKDVLMDSATVGIPRDSPDGYYEHVQWNVQITTGGEYVHSAPWSVDSQGHNNVSHGCINASPADAEWFYNFTRTGDIVEVKGSPRPPTAADGSADWNTPFSQWKVAPTPAVPAVFTPPPAKGIA